MAKTQKYLLISANADTMAATNTTAVPSPSLRGWEV